MKFSYSRFRRLTAFGCAVILASFALSARGDELKSFDAESFGEIGRVNKGRPYILAFWSLNCAPCKDEIAILKTVHAKHPDLAIFLVGTDAPNERAAVRRFLAQQKLGSIERWIFADEFEERIRYSVDPKWHGELPRSYLIDADGRASAQSGVLALESIEAWLSSTSQRR